jgi:protein SCO1/2
MALIPIHHRYCQSRVTRLIALLLVAATCMFTSPRSQASQAANQDCHADKKPSLIEAVAGAGKDQKRVSIPDLPVVTHEGKRVNFYSDLVKDKVVAINFLFTTCTTICPPLAATFSKVQSLGGDRVGRDFHLISISVDPVTDTPQRLKAWAAKFNVKQGWTFVTGKKEDIDSLLKAMGVYTARITDHSPMVIVSNDARGVWTRTYGLAPPAKLFEVIDSAINGSAAAAAAKEEAQK